MWGDTMKCAFLRINDLATNSLINKWRKPKPSYSTLTLEDTFSFILTAATIPESTKVSHRMFLYKTIATYLKEEGVVYILTNRMDTQMSEVFLKEFGFAFSTGRELFRILSYEILCAFIEKNKLSFFETNFGIYINRLDKYRQSFLSKSILAFKNLTIFTEKKAAFSSYCDDIYAQTGITIPVRDLSESFAQPDVLVALDSLPNRENYRYYIDLSDPDNFPIRFRNDNISPLLDGILPYFGAKETEFLLHSMPSRFFPHTSEGVYEMGFSIDDVLSI